MRLQNLDCDPFDLLLRRARPPCQTGRMAMNLIQILICTFPLLPGFPKENSLPSSRHSICPDHRYLNSIRETVLLLPQSLHAPSHQKLHHLLRKRLPRVFCQLFRCPLTIPLPHRPFVTLPYAFRLINHGGSLAPVIPFTSLPRMSHLAWPCASRPAHLGWQPPHRP